MKRLAIAALAAASLLSAGAAVAQPLHPVFGGGHPPHAGPVGFHPGPVVFHPGPGFGGPHAYPVGFHHWGYGEYLPAAWLIPTNFVVDFAAYDLAAPPPNFEWVENGPDALLVDLDTGMVVQVIPGAFA